MSVYEQDPGGIDDVKPDEPRVRWRQTRRYSGDYVEVFVDPRGKAEVRYVDQDGELLSDEALKSPNHLEQGRQAGIDDCVKFLEEEANVADRKGDFGGALILRRSLQRMRERVKP